MVRLRNILFFAPVLVVLAGCGGANVVTAVAADGSFTRTVTYSAGAMSSMGAAMGAMGSAMSSMGDSQSGDKSKPQKAPPTPEQTIRAMFSIPKSGHGVKVAMVKKNGTEDAIEVTRKVTPGAEPLADIVAFDEKHKPTISSQVAVQKLANGDLEYIETLHSLTPPMKGMEEAFKALRPYVKKALPARFQSDVHVNSVLKAFTSVFAHTLMGPPEPVMLEFMLNPDVIGHKVGSQVVRALRQGLTTALPGITQAEIKAILDQGRSNSKLKNLISSVKSQTDSPKESANSGGLTSLTFTTSFPGRIVRTNGLIDELTGEVYWSLMAPTLWSGDVKLTLVVHPRG